MPTNKQKFNLSDRQKINISIYFNFALMIILSVAFSVLLYKNIDGNIGVNASILVGWFVQMLILVYLTKELLNEKRGMRT
jgi:ABC-type uncharacterized transport system permease subunit